MQTYWRRTALFALLLVSGLVLAGWAVAADKKATEEAPPPTLADMWLVWPKHGHHKEFEAGMKEFVAWRKSQGEPYSWTVWSVAIGEDLDVYAIRSNGIEWKDVDAMRDWSRRVQANDQYEKLLAPHVRRVSRYMDEMDPELSRSKFEGDPAYVGVSTVKVLPGKWHDVKAALQTFKKSADEQNWSESWAVMYGIGGDGGLKFAWPYTSYADMADPEMKGSEMLEKALGSKEKGGEVMKSYGSGVKRVDYTVWARRPDLSTPKE